MSFDAAAFFAELGARPAPVATQSVAGAPVGAKLVHSDEAARIRDLPWADYSDQKIIDIALAWATHRWSRGPECAMQFRPIQATALLVAHLCGGAILPIGTGSGKTILALLIADAMGARKPLLFIPPALRASFDTARIEYNRSFKIPTNLRIMAYSQLSVASSTDILDKLAPDVFVGDEAHNLRHLDSSRVKRLSRRMKKAPETKCAFMSGTLTSKSVRDYAHLAAWALKDGSPVPDPRHFPVLQAFCNIMDAKPTRKSGDDRFVADARNSDYAMFSPLFPDWQDYGTTPDPYAEEQDSVNPRVDRARALFMDRLTHTPGVVGTDTASVGASLLFMPRKLKVPDSIRGHLADLEENWRRPDGETYNLAIEMWRCGRQLTQGFYYRWVWPDGVVDRDWMRTRAQWNRAVREVLANNRPHLDSYLLVLQAARRALAGESSLVADEDMLLSALEEWAPHSIKRWGRKRTPPTETVWLDDYLLQDALAWHKEHPLGLLWYGDNAVGDKLATMGIPVFGPNTNPEDINGAYGAALSILCHKDGKNLQGRMVGGEKVPGHHENLVLNFSPSGTWMEQLISRTHRSGQESDEVTVEYYDHTEPAVNAVASARNDARYIQETMRTPQRLCFGTWISP